LSYCAIGILKVQKLRTACVQLRVSLPLPLACWLAG
jgi:hypothetical protein